MTVKPMLTLRDPRLRLKGEPVDSFGPYLGELIDDLTHTMRDAPGVGLAAPQVGKNIRLFVIDIGDQPFVFINPEITKPDPFPILVEPCDGDE